jgi:uncharacterized ParB-like nuclease family protein
VRLPSEIKNLLESELIRRLPQLIRLKEVPKLIEVVTGLTKSKTVSERF